MFAVLGPIEFEALSSPEHFASTKLWTYAKHDVVEDRPRLQFLSQDLETIDLRMRWHVFFTNPQSQIDLLNLVADGHQALPLVFGNGIFRGWFVIVEISEQITHAADDGSLISAEATVKLTEYAFGGVDLTAPPEPDTPPLGLSPSVPAQPGVSALSATPAPVSQDNFMGGSFANMSFEQVPAEAAVRSPAFGGAGGSF